ncbi:Fis family transcriptional regulator [Kangiella sp. HD9-110m-PIT-SAG07]|nr:Fis family transcriptional regulator [Kangiella sp. HD9-110m-PIT-SAG07]
MKKNDKKTEKLIIKTLTDACHILTESVEGFEWLTHFVDYDTFPQSLEIVCIFDTEYSLSKALQEHQDSFIGSVISDKLQSINVPLKNNAKQISFDSEEACEKEHNSNWTRRLLSQ